MDQQTDPNVSSGSSNNGSVKKFKSQSLNSLFRKPASTESPTGSPSSSSATLDGAKAKPGVAGSGTLTPNSSTPKRGMTAFATATGTYKLAAMKREKNSGEGSPSSSNNNSPTVQSATVWKKAEEPKFDVTSPHSVPATLGTHNDQVATPASSLPKAELQISHDVVGKQQSDMSEEELLKKGIHLTQRLSTSEASQREFNWDEDDDDDEWQPSPEMAQKAKEAMEASMKENAPKPAPWSTAPQEQHKVVPIGEQIKELSEKKHQRHQPNHHHHQPPVFQNVPRFNYRTNPEFMATQNEDAERERYRYHDHEHRYRHDGPRPRPELFNASSGQVEPVPGRGRGSGPPGAPMEEDTPSHSHPHHSHRAQPEALGDRRYSNDRFSDRSVSPQDWRSVPRPEIHHPPPQRPAPQDRERERIARLEEEKRKEEEVRAQQAEYMKEAREKARKRKEEEVRLEEERKVNAARKAEEIAERMRQKAEAEQQERERKEQEAKLKREEAERERELKRQEAQKEKERAAVQARERERQREHERYAKENASMRTRAESIGEKQALDAVGSVLNETMDSAVGEKVWKKGRLPPPPTSATAAPTATAPGGIWNQQPNRSRNDMGLWGGGVRSVSGSRFTGLLPKEDLFTSKDDISLTATGNGNGGDSSNNSTPVWHKDWRNRGHNTQVPPTPTNRSQPVTPPTGIASHNTPENRGYSRFFPTSPQLDNSAWGGTGFQKESLPLTNRLNSMLSPSAQRSPSPDDVEDDNGSVSNPRVVLPQSVKNVPNGVWAGKQKPAVSKSELPKPKAPEIGGPPEEVPFPVLAREMAQQTGPSTQPTQPPTGPRAMSQRSKATQQPPATRPPHVETGASSLEDKLALTSSAKVKIPMHTVENVTTFELYPPLRVPERGYEEPIVHLSHYRDVEGLLHRREYEIDHGKPLNTWLIRLPGSPSRTILTRDRNNKIHVGEPPKRSGGGWGHGGNRRPIRA